MANYATIPDEVQPAAKTSWRRVVAVATAASFLLGAFALRTATPSTSPTVALFRLMFDPPEINGGVDCGFLCPATDGPPVPSFVDDQDEDEPEAD